MCGMNNERVCKHNPTFAQQRRAYAHRHREKLKGVRTREETRSARSGRLIWIPRFTFTTLTTNSTELPRHKRADWVSEGWLELRVRVTQRSSHSSSLFSSVVKKSLWANLASASFSRFIVLLLHVSFRSPQPLTSVPRHLSSRLRQIGVVSSEDRTQAFLC